VKPASAMPTLVGRLAIALLLAALGPGLAAAGGRAPRPAAAPPSLAELKNMSYSGFVGDTSAVTLVDGKYAGEPYVAGAAARRTVTFARDFRLTGDLDGDGQEEAVVLLAENTGGSGTFDYLAVVARHQDGKPVNFATAPLGDRVQVRDARIEGGRLVVDVLRAGPQDAMCCPGELATVAWRLAGGKLVEVATGVKPQRLSLAAIAGPDWVLRSWNWDEPVTDGVEVTFKLEGGRIGGRAACNRYSASVTEGQSLGQLSVGPAASTKMACPGPQMAAEDRFLKQLAGASSYSFLAGQLALGWSADGTGGTMLFGRKPTP
jgi:heat shock protein HslJ